MNLNQKKTTEIAIGSILIIVTVAFSGFMVYLTVSKATSSGGQNLSGETYPEVPLEGIKSAEKNALIKIKNLRLQGNIPVIVSGEEKSKANPFLADQGSNESPKYVTERFTINYPKTWSKNLDKDSNTVFKAPPKDGQIIASVAVETEDFETSKSLDLWLPKKASDILIGLPGLQLSSPQVDSASQINRGKVNFTYKVGDTVHSGWVAALAFSSPSQSLLDNIISKIGLHQNQSKFLKDLAESSGNSAENLAGPISEQGQVIVEELNALGETLKYNTPPYSTVITLYYDSIETPGLNYQADADSIYSGVTFIETISDASLPGSTDSLNTQPTSSLPTESETINSSSENSSESAIPGETFLPSDTSIPQETILPEETVIIPSEDNSSEQTNQTDNQ